MKIHKYVEKSPFHHAMVGFLLHITGSQPSVDDRHADNTRTDWRTCKANYGAFRPLLCTSVLLHLCGSPICG